MCGTFEFQATNIFGRTSEKCCYDSIKKYNFYIWMYLNWFRRDKDFYCLQAFPVCNVVGGYQFFGETYFHQLSEC
jgi:hypothetical protein